MLLWHFIILTTVDCAAFHLTRDYRDDEAIPIGKACRNMQIILLDKDGTPVPDGEAGEIDVPLEP